MGERRSDPPSLPSGGDAHSPGSGAPSFAAVPESHRIAQSLFSLSAGQIAARLIAFLATAYLARELGPAGFGIIGFAAAICGYLSLAITSGFHDLGAREVARHPARAGTIAASATLLRLALACIVLLVVGLVALYIDKPPVVKIVLVLSGLSFFSLALDTSWVHKGLEQNARVAIALVLGQSVYVAAVFLFVHGPDDVVVVPVTQFVGELAAAVVLAVPLLRAGKIRIHLREGVRLVKASGYLTLSRLLWTLIFTVDVVLLGLIVGEHAVGIYTAAYRVCFFLLAIGVATQVAYLPAFTRANATADGALGPLVTRASVLTSAIALPAVTGGVIVAGPLLGTLFGAEYAEGATALRLLLFAMGSFFLYGVVHNVFVVRDQTGVEAGITGVAAAVNVALNVYLIPRHGLVGAAFATAVAAALIAVLGFGTAARTGVRIDYRPYLRAAVASSVMGIALLLTGFYRNVFLSVGLGVPAYAVSLVLLGSLPEELRPYMGTLKRMGVAFRTRLFRVLYYLRGPTAEEAREAMDALEGREHYELYDRIYRDVARRGGHAPRSREHERTRGLTYKDFEVFRSEGLVPGPGSRLIDLGCGEGFNAVYFASLGYRVSAVDLSKTAIEMAEDLARRSAVQVEFRTGNVLDLEEVPDDSFDLATDIQCLHMLVRDADRQRYLATVRRVLRPGGRFFLFQRVTWRDVKVRDEARHILRSVGLVEPLWLDDDGKGLTVRGCGFRAASPRQYRDELGRAGFDLVRHIRRWGAHRPWISLLASSR